MVADARHPRQGRTPQGRDRPAGSVHDGPVAALSARRHGHAKMIDMTRLLTEAVAQARTLSAEEQDRIAKLVFALLQGPYEVEPVAE